MANPGPGNRFVSVNLNKSYGQSSNPNHSNNFSYGSGRARSSGNGGSMVVLSRPRSSHKAVPKLSVPSPLNLPSLRKEHERSDALGSVGGSVGGGIAGSGARPSSSGLGWSKPNAIVVVERDGVSESDRPLSGDGVKHGLHLVDRGGTSYMPPSSGSGAAVSDVSPPVIMGNTAVLRGEDFPSLHATLVAPSGPTQKPKDSTNLKQKEGMGEEISRLREVSHIDMRPQLQSHYSFGNSISVDSSDDHNSGRNSGRFRPLEQGRPQDYLLSPLPLVRLSPRSDWADDERDTSHGLTERDRDHSFSRTEAYWDKDFDLPRSNFLPQKPVQSHFDRRGQRDNDVGKGPSNKVFNVDPPNKDLRVPSRDGREGRSWRHLSSRNGYASEEVIHDKTGVGSRPNFVNHEAAKENKYTPSQFGGSTWDKHNVGFAFNRDLGYGRRDSAYHQGGRQQWNNSADPDNGRGAESTILHGGEFNRYRVDAPQSSTGSRSSFSVGRRGLAGSDHLSNFGQDKHSFSRGEKPYMEDSLMGGWGSNDFDVQDPFSAGILGVVKKKKDVSKHLDFHDPVRESFEAELERVQKIQERERQRAIEEQEKVIEIARREEEERQRVAREQEERQRRLEEEAREAVWRAEQEKLEAMMRAEEQRLAKEEEKKRITTEEDRRKQAAKQKLQELEERIARREAEAAKADRDGAADTLVYKMPKEREISRTDDFAAWEDGERMVERITNTASSDSSVGRPFDMGSRHVSTTEGSFAFADRGKSSNSRRRDVFENGNDSSFFSSEYDNGCQSPRPDGFVGGRAFPRKDFYGGSGYMPTRGYCRGGTAEPHMDDFIHARENRWSIARDGDPYGRHTELETEFSESVRDKFDIGWSQSRGRGCSPFSERLYENLELEALYTYGRSRYPARQPRVLPPPSLSSVHRTSYRNEGEPVSSSTYANGNIQYNHAVGSESAAASCQNAQEEHSDKLDMNEEDSAKIGDQERDRNRRPGCDSQSSLSVSSAPSSPTQLSHDDVLDSRESLAVADTLEGHDVCNSDNEAVFLKDKEGKGSTWTTPSSISVDDDEEWTVENNVLQQQEEYDEDVRYNEEVQDGDDENAELNREFVGMHLEEKGSSHMMDNVVLGFDQGVEVRMPNDECEISPRIVQTFVVGSFDGSRDGQSPLVANVLQQLTTDASCSTVQESEKAVQVSEPVNTPHTSRCSDPLSSGASSSVTILGANQSVPSSVRATSQSSQSVLPSEAVVQGATECPVKLQFGLFSGPSLIPSPVPAIQIGSIQMPLHLPPHISPSLTHMHAPQSSVFQFGQLSYPSPISQGISPLVPQSMSFLQPTLPPQYPSSGRCESPLSVQSFQDSSAQSSVNDVALPLTINSLHIQSPTPVNVCADAEPTEANLMAECPGSNDVSCQNQTNASTNLKDRVRPESCQQTEVMSLSNNLIRNSKPLDNKISEKRAQGGTSSSHFAANLGYSDGAAAQGRVSGGKGRRAFTARAPGARLSLLSNEASRSDVNGFHRWPRRYTRRFEFRVRQAADGKQSSTLPSSVYSASDSKSNHDANGSATHRSSGLKKDAPTDKPKLTVNSQVSSSDQIVTQNICSWIKEDKPGRKETSTSRLDTSWRAEGSLKRNMGSEDDIDTPLQSGIVRVFKQPGIEAPSDEDDFIEVRSKRQMLNDRREQREKEIKAKSSNMKKILRKSFAAPQGTVAAKNTGKTYASLSAQTAKSNHTVAMSRRGSVNEEVPATFNHRVSQTLAPIGTPPISADSQTGAKTRTMKPLQTSSCATDEQMVGSKLTFLAQNNSLDGVPSSTQLEEAIDKDMASLGDRTGSITERGVSSSSVLAKDNPLSSAISPISCLLAGGRIQFGAVTSPTILPPSTCVVPHNVRAPASSPLNIKISGSRPVSENDRALFFEKEKHSNELCQPLEDCEAEAEAAASAVAVAAISNDEVVGIDIGGRSASMSVSGGFRGANMDGMAEGMPSEQRLVSHPKGEETLSLSLPADLSVETPPISLWPPLPSPHGPSSQVPSPFSGGPSSHFPFYDMNPVIGGPVFAFGPLEESAGSQSQSQKSGTLSSSPLGTWQQCHPGVYSFYGPPTGLTAPFISPPGSIPEVQGPPHMVVYNHFAPVGQFGQVGLSYMGSTYISSGKQPDWKHNASTSAMGGSEGEINRLNVVPVKHDATNIPAHVQHVASGCPLQPMASPLAMFEVPPLQSGVDASVHPHWSHVQATSIHSIPQSMPLQQQSAGAMPAQIDHMGADHHSLSSLAEDKNATVIHLSNEHESVDCAVSSAPVSHARNVGCESQPEITAPDSLKVDAQGSESKRNSQLGGSGSQKPRPAHQKNPPGRQYGHYLRGGAHKKDSGAEWSSRKMGVYGRNHSSGGERGIPPAKVKQIYVAKPSTSGTTNAVETCRES